MMSLHTPHEAFEAMVTRTTISLPDALMSEIDELVGPRGRSGFLSRAARHELRRERLRRALEAARGATVGTPAWRSGDEVIRFVDGLRADDRDPWADEASEERR
jgi:Arc/MetJ family transcription regulator